MAASGKHFITSVLLSLSFFLLLSDNFLCAAEEVFVKEGFKGAALAINPQTGEVLFRYDSSNFLNTPFPTGSLIKPFTACAALEQDFSLRNLLVTCEPSSPFVKSFESCWYRPGHGILNMTQALVYSCDRYFRVLAGRVSPSLFRKTLVDFTSTDFERLDEWKQREILESMVGTGTKIRLTPVTILCAYTSFSNNGVLYQPGNGGKGKRDYFQEVRRLDLNPGIKKFIWQALSQNGTYGSGMDAQKTMGFKNLAGKTGTAPYFYTGKEDYRKTHGWFVGFFPAEKPRIAILVFLLEGKGLEAARIAGQIMRTLNGQEGAE